jgi:hypothetical protein
MSLIKRTTDWILNFPGVFSNAKFSEKVGWILIIVATGVILSCVVSLIYESHFDVPSEETEKKEAAPSKIDTPSKAAPIANSAAPAPAPVASSTKGILSYRHKITPYLFSFVFLFLLILYLFSLPFFNSIVYLVWSLFEIWLPC